MMQTKSLHEETKTRLFLHKIRQTRFPDKKMIQSNQIKGLFGQIKNIII